MRSWQIILMSAVAATIADASLFLPGALPWRPETAMLLLAHWPAIAVAWLGAYGTAALVLTTFAVFLEVRGTAPGRAGGDWARRYAVQLAKSQYIASGLILLGLGLSRVPIETAPFRLLPNPIGGSPALTVCAAIVVVGLIGGLLLAAALITAESPELRLRAPGIRAARLLPNDSEPPATDGWTPADAAARADVMETADLMETAAVPGTEDAAAPQAAPTDAALLAELLRREQRPVLEAIRDLATAVNRLRRDLRYGLGEIKVALEDRRSEQSTEAGSLSPSAVEHAATELRAVVAAVDTSVARLGEITSLLSAGETPTVAGTQAPISPAARSVLSAELQALLRDMTPATANGDPPG